MMSENAADDGSYTANYQVGKEARVHITADHSGAVTFISTEARNYKQTAEWIALKDAILKLPELSLPDGAVSAFTGTLARQSYNENYGDWQILVHNIDNFFIGIEKK